MSESTRKFFSGKTLEQAILLAASHYGLRSEEVRYREIEKRHGFTRTPKNVVIAVEPENPRLNPDEIGAAERERRAAASPPVRPRDAGPAPRGGGRGSDRGGDRGRDERGFRGGRGAESRRPRNAPQGSGRMRPDLPVVAAVVGPKRSETLARAEGTQAEAARRAVELLLAFVGIEAEADLYQAPERIEVELWGPDDRVLLEGDGRVLLAVEHLVPRMMRGLGAEPVPVRVDCDNFHLIREERLRELAQTVAAEVRQTGRYQVLDELDPSERRIIHVTLKEDPGVTTESLGDGYFKRLKVMPAASLPDVGAED